MKTEQTVDVDEFLAKNGVQISTNAKILLGKIGEKSVAIVSGTEYLNSGRPTHHVTFVTRVHLIVPFF